MLPEELPPSPGLLTTGIQPRQVYHIPDDGPVSTFVRNIPGYDTAHELREILFAPADNSPLKTQSGVEAAVNGVLRFVSGLSTPEAIAEMFIGAGLASKLPELVNTPATPPPEPVP